MKLEYKVLWIEDQLDTVSNYEEFLEDLLEDHGFLLDVDYKSDFTPEKVDELSDELNQYNPYDFIIFDYKLGDHSQNGLEVATVLRKKIFTDMIFYSADTQANLRQMLFEGKVDGVFIVSKARFGDDIEPIVLDHIKRMSDINNMRGLLLDEMSECDAILRTILKSKFSLLGETEQAGQYNKLRQSPRDSYKSNLSKKLGYNATFAEKDGFERTFDDLADDYQIIDFDKVRRRMGGILDLLDIDSSSFANSSVMRELQDLRNIFAHEKAIYSHNTVRIKNKTYTFTEFLNLRKQLIELKSTLKDLAS